MFEMHEPVAGTWYVNQTGKLMKVRMLVYKKELISQVMIEYLDGTTVLVDADSWYCLKLNRRIHEAGKTMILH